MNYKTYIFDLCRQQGTKICSCCNDCNDEPKIFINGNGRKYPVKDAELAEQVKVFALKNNVSFEKALLTLTSGSE